MSSFDIISEVNAVELRHAVENTSREIETRFDFRGVEASVRLNEWVVTVKSESEFQVQQLEDMFYIQCAKRNLDVLSIEKDNKYTHSGKFYSMNLTFKQGIEQPVAKEIVKAIKDSKIKVQASIMGEKIRVSGKKRDDLQEVMAMLRKGQFKQPLQFDNFRD